MAAARARVLGARWLQRTARMVVPLGARTASHITKDMLPGPYPRTPEERAAAAKKYNMRVEDYEPYPDDGMGYGDYPKLPDCSQQERDPWYEWDHPDLRLNWGEPMHWDIDMYIRNRVDTSPTPVSWNVMCKHLFGFVAFMVFMFWVGETYPTYQPVGWCVPKSLFFMQGNLLASGASDSEIFIWDLNNLSIPMTPGSKSQFGGKLVTFGLSSTPAHQVPQPHLHLVFIGQGTTESALLMWSAELQEALGSGNLPSYWQSRIQQASLQSEKMLWQFLKVTLEQDYRLKFLKLLGYNKDEFQKKVTVWLKNDLGPSESPQPQKDDLSSNRLQASCSQVQ